MLICIDMLSYHQSKCLTTMPFVYFCLSKFWCLYYVLPIVNVWCAFWCSQVFYCEWALSEVTSSSIINLIIGSLTRRKGKQLHISRLKNRLSKMYSYVCRCRRQDKQQTGYKSLRARNIELRRRYRIRDTEIASQTIFGSIINCITRRVVRCVVMNMHGCYSSI